MLRKLLGQKTGNDNGLLKIGCYLLLMSDLTLLALVDFFNSSSSRCDSLVVVDAVVVVAINWSG